MGCIRLSLVALDPMRHARLALEIARICERDGRPPTYKDQHDALAYNVESLLGYSHIGKRSYTPSHSNQYGLIP